MERRITKQVQGFRTKDGAGVSLVRVLGNQTVDDFDPFLMLDAFDTTNPADYIEGFPMHPHRGIETFTFLSHGSIMHKDHLGTIGMIHDGEAQWLTAGSGAFHEEMPQETPRLLGIQLWLNLPADKKMEAEPFYHGVLHDSVEELPLEGGTLRLMAGNYTDDAGVVHSAIQGKYLPLDFYDIHLDEGASVTLPISAERSAMVFTLEGDAAVGGAAVAAKTAAKLGEGDSVTISAPHEPIEILLMSSIALHEPVAWYGPIVMNTTDELVTAFQEIQEGTFVKQATHYENAE